jgi:hypothetical protein
VSEQERVRARGEGGRAPRVRWYWPRGSGAKESGREEREEWERERADAYMIETRSRMGVCIHLL